MTVLFLCPILQAGTITLDFEGIADSSVLTTQYPGVTFTNAQILTAGISLNEFEFPPRSGMNVVSDNGGPITITFSAPIGSFSGYFTYLMPLTLTAFGIVNNQVGTSQSPFSNNLACLAGPPCSGDASSNPNEFIQINSVTGISSLTIMGDPNGGSFALDDVTYTSAVPEPATIALFLAATAGFAIRRKIL